MEPKAFEVFFDGECPLCMREVNMLRRFDRKERILFTDIAAPGFDPTPLGLTHAELMERIWGRMADGTLVTGVEVFRQLYGAVGFGSLVAVTRIAGIAGTLDAAYSLFAKNRLRLTGRCTPERCELPVREH
jgi:predicted DCC family thiol-disulfide oxidoreductase YuxK